MKYDVIQATNQLTDLFKHAPDIDAVNPKDSDGNVELDIGKHVLPCAVIGAGIALYADTVKRMLPGVSVAVATTATLEAGVLYEQVESCTDTIKGAHGITEVCTKGYLDGATFEKATFDSVADILFGTTVGTASAMLAVLAIYNIRKHFIGRPHYKVTERQNQRKRIFRRSTSEKAQNIIQVIPSEATS